MVKIIVRMDLRAWDKEEGGTVKVSLVKKFPRYEARPLVGEILSLYGEEYKISQIYWNLVNGYMMIKCGSYLPEDGEITERVEFLKSCGWREIL